MALETQVIIKNVISEKCSHRNCSAIGGSEYKDVMLCCYKARLGLLSNKLSTV